MEEKIVLEPFNRILSGFEKLAEVSVSISDCSALCRKYQKYGVEAVSYTHLTLLTKA